MIKADDGLAFESHQAMAEYYRNAYLKEMEAAGKCIDTIRNLTLMTEMLRAFINRRDISDLERELAVFDALKMMANISETHYSGFVRIIMDKNAR